MQTVLNAAQFEAKFQNAINQLLLKDFIIIGEVSFPLFDSHLQSIVIQNCEFKSSVSIENININGGITFQSTVFHDLVRINKIESDERGIEFKYSKYSLILLNSSVDKLVFTDSYLHHGILIAEDSKIKHLTFSKITSVSNSGVISIENTEVFGNFDITNLNFGRNIQIINSTIKCKLRITFLDAKSIYFSESHFYKPVFIIGGKIEHGISINQCEFTDKLDLIGIKINSTLTLKQTIFNNSFKIDFTNTDNSLTGTLKAIYIFETGFGNSMILNGRNQNLNLLEIEFSNNVKGIININDSIFSKLNFRGVNVFANVILNNCKFNAIELNQFSNYGNLTFSNCQANSNSSNISFVNSNLGKTQLFSFDFSSFSQVKIIDSLINEILTLNIKWFEDGNLTTSESTSQDFVKRRDVYRQIKQSYERQGDKITSLLFKTKELKAFERQIELRNKYCNLDWYILFLSKSNNYGLNWGRPIMLLICFTFLFYIFIAIAASQNLMHTFSFKLSDIKFTFQEIYNYGYIFPQLFNPTRITNRMFVENQILGFWVYFWDSLHRIILAFFIVQTIAAFRKYHEK